MAAMSPHTIKEIMVQVRKRYLEIDRADWDGRHYRTSDLDKWERATTDVLRSTSCAHPAEWLEIVRILSQGWDYYGGSDLPGERGR
jgi:hypothetical protein